MVAASSMVLPLIHSVASDDDAIAEPQPKGLNLASSITPASFTRICRRMTSPQAGAPRTPRRAGAVQATPGPRAPPAPRPPDQARADRLVFLIERADVAGVFVVFDDFFAV